MPVNSQSMPINLETLIHPYRGKVVCIFFSRLDLFTGG